MAQGKKKKEKSGGPSYMVLYANLMTLLMTFFIVLVCMGIVEKEKVKAGVGAFRKSLLSGGLGMLWENTPISFDYLMEQEKIKIKKEISTSLKKNLEGTAEEEISIITTEEGVFIKFPGKILFELGEADLKPKAKKILEKIVPLLKDYSRSYNICIEGHTDNLPIHNKRFSSNWELSAARAISVVKYFQEKGLSSERLSAAGYGEYRPLVPNDTADNRALNRRIEILIKVSSNLSSAK